MCGKVFSRFESVWVSYCNKCVDIYKDKRVYVPVSKRKDCPFCVEEMFYLLLDSEYDWFECESCGYAESVY
jgi:hypothetical protein